MMKNLIDLILWAKKSRRPGFLRTALSAGVLATGLMATNVVATDWVVGPYDPNDPLSAAIISTDDGDFINLANSTGATVLQNGDNFVFQGDDLLFFGGDASTFKQVGSITTKNGDQGTLFFGMADMDPSVSVLQIGSVGSEDKWLNNLTADGGTVLVQDAWIQTAAISQIDPSIAMNISFTNANLGSLLLLNDTYVQITNEANIGVFSIKDDSKALLAKSTIDSMYAGGDAVVNFLDTATIGILQADGNATTIFQSVSTVGEIQTASDSLVNFRDAATVGKISALDNSQVVFSENAKVLRPLNATGTAKVYFEKTGTVDTAIFSNASSLTFLDTATVTSLGLLDQSEANFYKTTTITDMTMANNSFASFAGDSMIASLSMRGGSKMDFGPGVNAAISNFKESATLEDNSTVSQIVLGKNTKLTLGSGVYEGRILQNAVGDNASVTKAGNSTLALSGANDYWGGTFINAGTLEARNHNALGHGSVTVASGATLRVGNQDARTSNSLNVNEGEWSGNGNLELVASTQGTISRLSILPGVDVSGSTAVKIVGQIEDINRWGGQVVAAGLTANSLVLANSIVDTNAFVFESVVLIDKAGNRTEVAATEINGTRRFETSRYGFEYKPVVRTGYTTWNMTLVEQPVVVPDLSTMVLTNIIGFEIPRAQNVNGPWVRMKGGELNDDKAHFDKTTYQSLQVGWDKTFNAAMGNGSWNAGMFFEGDWSYGRGHWSSMWNTIQGNLKSKSSGVGAGLYVSRGFKNGWYGDVIGRINVFENDVTMKTYTGGDNTDNDYRGKWSNSIFNLALEFGKDMSSRDGRWTLNPYNRLIYTNAPSRQFNVVFDDLSIVKVNNRAVDAWTNKLGARLAYNSKCEHRKTKNIYYVGADWYKGLSGRFTTETLDTLNPTAVAKDDWKTNPTNRPKNNLDYGTATFGATFLPTDVFALTAQADVLFGDVDGYSVSLSGKFSF